MDEALREFKISRLEYYKRLREQLDKNPVLKNLFFEFTLSCNERCFHCGSSCEGAPRGVELHKNDWISVIDEVASAFDPKPMLCITGGEPLLYEDLFEVMGHAASKGFKWGMTTNATLIDEEKAALLKKAGMNTVSVSIDGLPKTHDAQRGLAGGYERAMRGLGHLTDTGFEHVQVTTVVNHESLQQLDELFEIMRGIDIDSWRIINLEPIGRALEYPEKMLTAEDYRSLFEFIRNKRIEQYPVRYGCAHYLGPEYERDVRDWFFLCTAGRYTASIMADGSVGACLDIERNERTIRGNIKNKPFTMIWREDFELFRQPLSNLAPGCKDCSHADFCAGGACHSFDYETGGQRMCFKDILF